MCCPFPPLLPPSSPQKALDPALPRKKCHSNNWEEVSWWLLPLFLFFLYFTHAFSRIVVSGRDLGKVKKTDEMKLKSPLSLSKLLVPEAAEVTGLVADGEKGLLWHCTACVKHHSVSWIRSNIVVFAEAKMSSRA